MMNTSKAVVARRMMCSVPGAWFREAILDERDRALLDAEPVYFVNYAKGSFVRTMVRTNPIPPQVDEEISTDHLSQYHKKRGQPFDQVRGFGNPFSPRVPANL